MRLRQVERSTRNGNLPFQRYLRPIRMWSNMPGEGIGWRSQRYGSPWSESPGDKVQTRGKEQNHRTIANFYYLNTNRRKGLKKDQKKRRKEQQSVRRKPEKASVLAATKGCKNSKKQRLGVTSTVFLTDISIYGLSKLFLCILP